MKKLVVSFLLVFLSCGIFTSCINSNKNEESNKNSEIVEENNKEEIIEVDHIKEKIDEMSLEEKIGQMLVVGFQGTEITANLENLIKKNKVGGVILIGDNVTDVNGVIKLNNDIKKLNEENDIPLLISVDEEGGSVSRVPGEFIEVPTSEFIGRLDSEEISYNTGKVIGEQIKALGFNMDYAPVLDILSNPDNTVIGDRAYGNNADIVSRLGISTMNGLESEGVIPVVKHFPGHGDTYVDSHYGLPIVYKTLEELNSLEFIPFKDAIDSGADAVMVSHIILSNIDSENPASLSKDIVKGILRDNLGFNGVVVTDDMTMGAIVNNFDIGSSAIKAINAGVDIILVCHDYEMQIKVIEAIRNAVRTGEISEAIINESVYRVLTLKDKYKVNDNPISTEVNIDEINNKINNIFQ